MKLETKLNLSTGLLVLAMLISATSVHRMLSREQERVRLVAGARLPFIKGLERVRGDVASSVLEIAGALFDTSGGEAPLTSRGEARRHVEAGFPRLAADGLMLDQGPSPSELKTLSALMEDLERAEDEEMQLEGRGASGVEAARTLFRETILPLNREIASSATSIVERQTAINREDLVGLQDSDRNIVATLWGVTLAGAFLGWGVSFLLSRQMTRGIDLIAGRANAIADGDLSGNDLGLDSHDQLGMLAATMNRMQSSLGGIIGTVADTAGSLTGSADSMRSASDLIHRRIDQQSQQTQQAATAMQEMSASIAEVSRHTQSAAETARGAAQTAREGGLIVKQMLDTMHSIASAVSDTSSTVGLLGEDSKRISQIVTVIDEIARKTNLLALNAAIEAARAGDQGRGFAVVAGEVRRLAESTAQATGEIGTMIQEIQDRTRTAIASMKSGRGTVEAGVVTTTQAGEALERIIGMAERVDRMITQIAIAASQQAAAADQSSASLDSIHTLSHENLTEMATTAAGIESLRGTAVTLERQVDRFHVQEQDFRRQAA